MIKMEIKYIDWKEVGLWITLTISSVGILYLLFLYLKIN